MVIVVLRAIPQAILRDKLLKIDPETTEVRESIETEIIPPEQAVLRP